MLAHSVIRAATSCKATPACREQDLLIPDPNSNLTPDGGRPDEKICVKEAVYDFQLIPHRIFKRKFAYIYKKNMLVRSSVANPDPGFGAGKVIILCSRTSFIFWIRKYMSSLGTSIRIQLFTSMRIHAESADPEPDPGQTLLSLKVNFLHEKYTLGNRSTNIPVPVSTPSLFEMLEIWFTWKFGSISLLLGLDPHSQ